MKILIIGFYGWGNCGDEAILGGICEMIRRIDPEIEVEIATDIPFTMHAEYMSKILCPLEKKNVRVLSNFSMNDIDLVLLGGGGLTLGYGYGLVTMAAYKGIPVIYFGGAIHRDCVSSEVFKSFSKNFSTIVPRSGAISKLMTENDISNTLGFCPSVYAQVAGRGNLPDSYVVVTPRMLDRGNDIQVDLIVNELQQYRESMHIILAPFSREDLEGNPIDLLLCRQIMERIPESHLITWSGYDYAKTRCLFQNASLVINTGRYHSALFAAEFGVPLKCSVTQEDLFPAASHKIHDLFTDLGEEPPKMWNDGFTYIERWNERALEDLSIRGKRTFDILKLYIGVNKCDVL